MKPIKGLVLAIGLFLPFACPPISAGPDSSSNHAALAPRSGIETIGDDLWKMTPVAKALEKKRTVRLDLIGDGGPAQIGAGMEEIFTRDPRLAQRLGAKWKEVLAVLHKRYPKTLEVPASIVLVAAEKGNHPHLLALRQRDRVWDKELLLAEPAAAGTQIYIALGLFIDPRASADMLAHLVAEGMDLTPPMNRAYFGMMIADDMEAVARTEALKKSARYDAIAKDPEFIHNAAQMDQRLHHNLWDREETAAATIRKRVLERRPDLWAAYEEVRKLLADGKIRACDLPEPLLRAQEAFYAMPFAKFVGSDHGELGLWAVVDKDKASYFGTYGMALVKSFPELFLNPVVFGDSGAKKNKDEAIGAMQYRLAVKHPETWKAYVEARESLREPAGTAELFGEKTVSAHDAIVHLGHKNFEGLCKHFVDEKDSFGGSYVRALVESFPGVGLNPLSFPHGGREQVREGDVRAALEMMFARNVPELWKKSVKERDKIRRGEIDPKDFPPDMAAVMDGFYGLGRDKGGYPWQSHLSLLRHAKNVEDTSDPFFRSRPSVLLNFLLPEFPWTRVRFHEKNRFHRIDHVAQEMRYALSQEDQGATSLYARVRAVEKKIQGGEMDVNEFSPEYCSVVEDLVDKVNPSWMIAHFGTDVFLGSAVAGRKPVMADFFHAAFPDLEINPVALQTPGTWGDPVMAVREVRFRLALKFPELWDAYKRVAKRIREGKIPHGEFPPELIYVMEAMHGLKPHILESTKEGLGLATPLRKGRPSAFGAKPLTLLKMSFPDIPWSVSMYSRIGTSPDAEEKKWLARYRLAKSKSWGAAALGWTFEDFKSYLAGLQEEEQALALARKNSLEKLRIELESEMDDLDRMKDTFYEGCKRDLDEKMATLRQTVQEATQTQRINQTEANGLMEEIRHKRAQVRRAWREMFRNKSKEILADAIRAVKKASTEEEVDQAIQDIETWSAPYLEEGAVRREYVELLKKRTARVAASRKAKIAQTIKADKARALAERIEILKRQMAHSDKMSETGRKLTQAGVIPADIENLNGYIDAYNKKLKERKFLRDTVNRASIFLEFFKKDISSFYEEDKEPLALMLYVHWLTNPAGFKKFMEDFFALKDVYRRNDLKYILERIPGREMLADLFAQDSKERNQLKEWFLLPRAIKSHIESLLAAAQSPASSL